MKIDKIKIPFKSQEFEETYDPSSEDILHMENLAKENKFNKLKKILT